MNPNAASATVCIHPADNIDIDCGGIVEGHDTVDAVGERIGNWAR